MGVASFCADRHTDVQTDGRTEGPTDRRAVLARTVDAVCSVSVRKCLSVLLE